MRSNKDKWDALYSIIEEKIRALIANYTGPFPEMLYNVSPNGSIDKWKVLELRYTAEEFRFLFYTGTKPTNIDLIALEEGTKKNPSYDSSRLFFLCSKLTSYGKHTMGVTLKDLDGGNWFMNEVNASLVSKQRKDQAEDDAQKIASGTHIKCARCGKVVPKNESHPARITGRGRDSFGKAKLLMYDLVFCSGTCAAHEQWAHEG